ncbi:undecaprenyldiphospho-muramoylpentapeptide beta-N-acetylglucosaminyltransferase [Apilactobacillus micheneri]|uniref:UDP-N-acetylglucosamine--N-acetylmuramyl-(pentapeptide) pyrophosphoryl-undecaprenol N-acetylglucosamine transferase n=1 Tax=Apilactobacillus micheneri TaxID=1899430 RepID=A0ABY2YZ04_9LACO|nr:undecaprenyldiphospho-muramoylpentapeptide beta-N-acetylglucosaminyltransferase [Apilactobacillus micheneri]TPR25742.1 undecaprenyldiphospho-muramoylpentapeptide beta-N-acetylglucosaminyltransferase [Apilactobacillus micheneri]TPR26846.1 undecaprenyldiphospho-muramoylpentapeptide beta-N-acetylglucosaminyltransferase [Apilactobacillus micheneri]TPR28634.1 undecaprenyldiphospho-muramoylpentapeptide beta-N-acetylglucosaminyltransferase [Apilactobacillus micheneri]TPR29321.1 undecaprenyldiphosph
MRLIVSGGGTGGHIYPALALIEEVIKKEPDSKILYVGSTRGLEKDIVPKKGIDFKELEIQGFKRSISLYNFKTVALFLKSVHKSKKIIKDFKPDVVIGTGGYVSGAVVYAAAKLHVPSMIHEQNSVVGLTNRFLSKYVDKIAVGFEDAIKQFPKDKTTYTGNPRAQQVANIKSDFNWSEYGLKNDVPTVLIFGGSQGALKINQVVSNSINQFNKRSYQVVFVTGAKRYDSVMETLSNVKLSSNIIIKKYISDMPNVLPKVDLIVGRAGATSLAEITSLGIPSILIPSPYVTADHQTKNALSLVKNDAALIITENDLSTNTLMKNIDFVMHDKDKRDEMANNSRNMGCRDSSSRLFNLAKSIIK